MPAGSKASPTWYSVFAGWAVTSMPVRVFSTWDSLTVMVMDTFLYSSASSCSGVMFSTGEPSAAMFTGCRYAYRQGS